MMLDKLVSYFNNNKKIEPVLHKTFLYISHVNLLRGTYVTLYKDTQNLKELPDKGLYHKLIETIAGTLHPEDQETFRRQFSWENAISLINDNSTDEICSEYRKIKTGSSEIDHWITCGLILRYKDNLKHTFSMDFFIKLIDDKKKLELHLKKEIIDKTQELDHLLNIVSNSESKLMLSQINSHFMFNILTTIHVLMLTNPIMAGEAISSFSKLIKYQLRFLGNDELYHFEQIIDGLNSYIDLQNICFEGKIQMHYNFVVLSFWLPSLILQPLIENSIKHGFINSESARNIWINTYIKEDYIVIEVKDDGLGFDVDNVIPNVGIGISNLRRRLHNLCNGTLQLNSKIGEGTTAVITLPLSTQPSKDMIEKFRHDKGGIL